jgi:hypothetical protein
VSDRIVKPIRAWAEYDEWSVFLDHYTAHDERWYFESHLIPKGREGAHVKHDGFTGVANFFSMLPDIGPLRSLRVLYQNGYALELDAGERHIRRGQGQ